jgi:hypothetical protein
METQEEVMREKMEEEEGRHTSLFNELEKASLQMFKKLNEDIERARKEKEMKVLLNGKLNETRRKMKELEGRRKGDFKL